MYMYVYVQVHNYSNFYIRPYDKYDKIDVNFSSLSCSRPIACHVTVVHVRVSSYSLGDNSFSDAMYIRRSDCVDTIIGKLCRQVFLEFTASVAVPEV